MVEVKHIHLSLALNLSTTWGPVEIQPQVLAVLLGDDMLLLGRSALGILGMFLNAQLDKIARSKFEGSANAYCLYKCRRISLISCAEDPAMARSLE